MKHVSVLILFIFFVIWINSIFSQQQNRIIDSLIKLEPATPEKDKAGLFNKIAVSYMNISPQKMIEYARKAKDLAEKYHDREASTNATGNMAIAWFTLDKLDSAENNFNEALAFYLETRNKDKIAHTYNALANVYDSKKKFGKALEYYRMSLNISKEIKDTLSMATTMDNIGSLYFNLNKYDSVAVYYFEAIRQYEKSNNKNGVARCFYRLGLLKFELKKYDEARDYYNRALTISKESGNIKLVAQILNGLGLLNQDSNDYDKAMEYFRQSLEIKQKMKYKNGIGVSLGNLANVYKRTGDYSRALDYYQQSYNIFKEIDFKEGLSEVHIELGDLYLKTKEYNKAVAHMQQGIQIATAINSQNHLAKGYEKITELYLAMGDYKKAYDQYKKYIQFRDSLGNEKVKKHIEGLQVVYEVEKKDKELANQNLELANQKSQKYVVFIIALTLLLITLVAIYIIRDTRKKKKQVEHELLIANHKSLNMLTDAHATKGIFSAIQDYIYHKEPGKAVDVFNHFARYLIKRYYYLTRVVFELDKEIEIIMHYTRFQQELYSNRFTTQIDIEEGLNTPDIKIPPLFIYTFVENAIEHGLKYKETNDGMLLISVKKVDRDHYVYTVEDNGIGLTKSKELNRDRESTGLKNLEKRIEYLKKLSNSNFNFRMEELYDDQGLSRGTRAVLNVSLN